MPSKIIIPNNSMADTKQSKKRPQAGSINVCTVRSAICIFAQTKQREWQPKPREGCPQVHNNQIHSSYCNLVPYAKLSHFGFYESETRKYPASLKYIENKEKDNGIGSIQIIHRSLLYIESFLHIAIRIYIV